MSSLSPSRPVASNFIDAPPPVIDAPAHLVSRYVELTNQRRLIDDELAYLRGELELLAAASLNDDAPRGRFLVPDGGPHVTARRYATCSFDRARVGQMLQRAGLLTDVATIQPMALMRFLERDPRMAARLGELVRARHGILLTALG